MHLAALPDDDNGCFISPKLLKSPLFRFCCGNRTCRLPIREKPTRKYLDHLITELRASRHVRKAVLLGMDGFYDQTAS